MTTTHSPPPPQETTLHPDDSTSLTSISMLCVTCNQPMFRVDKEVSTKTLRPHTRYTYACSTCDSKVFVDVAHAA